MLLYIKKRQKGFGLIELLVSAGILLIVASAVAATLVAGLKINTQNLNANIATEIIQTVLEKESYSDSDEESQINTKPSKYVSGFSNLDNTIAVDIYTKKIISSDDEDETTAKIKEIKVVVSSGQRSTINESVFNNKRFISQGVKRVQDRTQNN